MRFILTLIRSGRILFWKYDMTLEEYKNKVFLERPEVKEEYERIKEEIIYKDRNEDE